MKAWCISPNFGLANLKLVQREAGLLGDYEIRVKIKACSLNYRDLLVAKGIYNPTQALPLVPVSDGAGKIIEIGSKVTKFKIGDRVCALFSQNWEAGRVFDDAQKATLGSPLPGMLQEEGVFHERGLIKFPSYLSYEEASTLPCAALTAFNALACEASCKPGDIVLLEGTGGVSLFALQFAKILGCTTIITSSDNHKLARCKELGADYLINYCEDPDWHKTVLKLTNKQGADIAIEVGGAKTLNQAILATRRGGCLCLIGIVSGASGPVDLVPILMKQIRIFGVFVGAKTVFESMNRVLEHSAIHPVISKVFAFDQAPAAFSYLESGKHMGKVVIKMSP